MLTVIWGLCHKQWWTLLVFISYAGFSISIVAGIKGNEFAWKSKNWESEEQFHLVQRKWATWAVGIFLVLFLITLSLALLPILVL